MTTKITSQWQADSTWVRMSDGVNATILRTFPEAATDDEMIADARKMAAALDLLAACEAIVKMVDDPWRDAIPTWSGVFDAARTAIAKARGGNYDHD